MKRTVAVLLVLVMAFTALCLTSCKKKNKENAAKTYTVEWVDYDGTPITYLKDVPEGTTPAFGGKEPTRSGYVFEGWDPAPAPITGDTTYTAKYRELNTQVSADEFAEALAFAGNFTAKWELFEVEMSLYQLDDGSWEYFQTGEDGGVVIALKREDGNFDYSTTVEFDSDGNPLFGEVTIREPADIAEAKEKGFLPRTYLSQCQYSDLAYDADKGEYTGKFMYEDNLLTANFRFEDQKLVKVTISAQGVSMETTVSNHGKTALPDAERFRSGARGGVVHITEDEKYWDTVVLTLPSAKAGDEFTFDAYVNVEDLPDTFDPAKDKITCGAAVMRSYVNDQDEWVDEEYTDDDCSIKISFEGADIATGGAMVQGLLTQTVEGETVAVGKGVYYLPITLTLNKDLKEGNNYVTFVAELKQALTLTLAVDEKNGYDTDEAIPLTISKAGENFAFDLIATYAVHNNFDPTTDQLRVDVQLVDENNEDYRGDDDFRVEMTYAEREIGHYNLSTYAYMGALTQSAESDVSLGAGTYAVHISATLLKDLPKKNYQLVVTLYIA